MGSPVLRGVSDAQYRSTLSDLQGEGWAIQKTNGGHLKLTHPRAERPVFGSFTPSDHRTSRNLITECRSAIRLTGQSGAAPGATLSAGDCEDILKRNKKQRKKDKRGNRGQSALPAPLNRKPTADPLPSPFDSGPASRASTAIPATMMPSDPQGSAKKADEGSDTRRTARRTPAKARRVKSDAATPASSPDTKKAAPMSKAQTKPDVETDSSAGATVTQLPVTPPAPAPASAAQVPGDIERIDPDVLALARKIASGAYREMTITADMVGQTLLYDGTVMITDGAPAASASQPAAQPEAAEPAPAAPVEPKMDATNTALMTNLETFGPGLVTVADLGNLLWEEAGFKSAASAQAAFAQRLRKFAAVGRVSEGRVGQKVAFKLVS